MSLAFDDTVPSVLVVGAGCTGIATALELSRQGVRCRIVDRMPAANTESRGTGIQARTLELLQLYGAAEDVVRQGNLCRGLKLFIEGEQIGEVDFTASDSRFKGSPALPQAVTERILRTRLAAFGVSVEFATEVTSIEQDKDGCVAHMTLPDGSTEAAHFAWVVAADGARSPLRETAGLNFDGISYPEGWGLMDAKLDWGQSPDAVRIFQGKGAQQIVIVPLGGTSYRLQIDHRAEELQALPPTIEEMQTAIDRLVPFPATASAPGWHSAFRIHRRQVVTYRKGRMLLAGDAAHIHTPAGGQGLNTGIQDGINLGWKIALVANGTADLRLIDSYEAERKPIAAAVLELSETLARNSRAMLGHPDTPARVLANRVGQLVVNYRDGPLGQAGGEQRRRVAGDRLPDISIAGRSTYERLQDSGFIVALFGGAEAGELATSWPGIVCTWNVDLDDPEGALADAIGIVAGAVVIRPDAYLGLVERSSAPANPIGAWLTDTIGLVGRSDR